MLHEGRIVAIGPPGRDPGIDATEVVRQFIQGEPDGSLSVTKARSPISAFTAAIALSAHCWAHSTASSGLTSPPTLPVVHQLAGTHRQLART